MSKFRPTTQRLSQLITRAPLALAGLIAVIATPSISLAADYTVTTADDTLNHYAPGSSECGTPCSLRAAVMAANVSGEEDNILLGTVDPSLFINGSDENAAMTGDLDITDDVTIIGQANERNIISASGLNDRVFHVLSGANAVLENVVIQGGELVDDTGAGIYVAGAGFLELTNVELSNNRASLVNEASSFLISGGGLTVEINATAIIESSSIVQNDAPIGGGISNLGRTDIRNSVISDNAATNNSGQIDDATGNGGGINNLGGYLSIGNSSIIDNRAGNNGGGLFLSTQGLNVGNVVITNTTVSDNEAFSNGAGIANVGPLTLSHSSVGNNVITGQGNGAGIFNSGTASLGVVNSTISTNRGARSGGGIFNSRDMSLTNVTIYNNSATPTVCAPSDTECAENNTLGGNQLTLFKTTQSTNPSAVIANTILANGPNSNPGERPCAGSAGYDSYISSLGNSLENDTSCALINSGDLPGVADVGLDPQLQVDPNFDNTTAVHAVLDNSPAIDTGSASSCPVVDQRYLVRDTACDIGAYEYGADQQLINDLVDLKVTITDSPDPVAPSDNSQPLQFVVMVNNLYVDTSANGVVVSIDLPDSYQLSNLSFTSTAATPVCDDPNVDNVIVCDISSIPGLGRVEFFISGHPTVEGVITTKVNVFSATQDAFPQNNENITEETVVERGAGEVDNFGGNTGSGGGGVPHPLTLLLATLVLLRRRIKL